MFGRSPATTSKALRRKPPSVLPSVSVTNFGCHQHRKNNSLRKTNRRWIFSRNQRPRIPWRCMTIQRRRRDKSDRSSRNQDRLSRFNPGALALGLSLLSLVGSGWLKSGGLKLAISGVATVLLIGALVKIFRVLDFSSPRLVNGTPRQLAWIRIVVCLTALIYTLMEDLPAFSTFPAGMRNDYQFFHLLNTLPGYSTLLSNSYSLGALQWTTATLLFLGLIGLQT